MTHSTITEENLRKILREELFEYRFDIRTPLPSLEARKESVQAEVSAIETEMRRILKYIDEMRVDYTTRINLCPTNRRVNELENEVVDHRQHLSSLQGLSDDYNERLNKFETRLMNAEKDTASAGRVASGAQERLDKQLSRLNASDRKLTAGLERIEGLSDIRKEAEAAIREELSDLRMQIESIEARRKDAAYNEELGRLVKAGRLFKKGKDGWEKIAEPGDMWKGPPAYAEEMSEFETRDIGGVPLDRAKEEALIDAENEDPRKELESAIRLGQANEPPDDKARREDVENPKGRWRFS